MKIFEEFFIGVYDVFIIELLLKFKFGWIIGFFWRMWWYFDLLVFMLDLDVLWVFKFVWDFYGLEMLKFGVYVFYMNF